MTVIELQRILNDLPQDAQIKFCVDGMHYRNLFSVTQTEPDVVVLDNDQESDS